MTPLEAEKRLLKVGFVFDRSKGSHRIYCRGVERVVVPFHAGRVLHPKIAKEIIEMTE